MDRRAPVLAGLFTCALGFAAQAATPDESLFDRLGGTLRVTAIVDTTIDELAARPEGDALRERVADIKADLLARICALSGGGCRYPSKKVAALPPGNEMLEALRMAMRTHGVPLAARNELLEALATQRRDVARL